METTTAALVKPILMDGRETSIFNKLALLRENSLGKINGLIQENEEW